MVLCAVKSVVKHMDHMLPNTPKTLTAHHRCLFSMQCCEGQSVLVCVCVLFRVLFVGMYVRLQACAMFIESLCQRLIKAIYCDNVTAN